MGPRHPGFRRRVIRALRPKMAPPRIPTEPDRSWFVFSPIMRTRRLGGRGAAAPRIGLEAGFFGVFYRRPGVGLVLPECESSSELPPDYELPAAISRAR